MTRTQSFIIFFSIVITLYALLNLYMFLRARSVVPQGWRTWFTVIFWLLASLYIVGRVIEKIIPSATTSFIIWVGSYWLGIMAYSVVMLLIIDILRLLLFLVPIIPRPRLSNEVLGVAFLIILSIAVITSRLNAIYPRIVIHELLIPKQAAVNELTVVAVSDIHLGTLVCNDHFQRIVDKINNQNPDLILLVGDILDEDVEPVIRNNLGATLQQLKATYGVYGITGNHEYIGGVDEACRYLKSNGVVILRDTAILVDNSIVIAGREDVSSYRFNGYKRKSLSEIISFVDVNKPVIVLDHQPLSLHESIENDVDLHLSGHTHHGQLFPFNFIASAVYDVSWGFTKRKNTNIYVSCGVGTWGPPMRSGNRPEIVVFKMRFLQGSSK